LGAGQLNFLLKRAADCVQAMQPWELLLRNVNVLHSVLEKAEPELSLLELDSKRLFILCMVEANASLPTWLARLPCRSRV
jgi:hypothetical protein